MARDARAIRDAGRRVEQVHPRQELRLVPGSGALEVLPEGLVIPGELSRHGTTRHGLEELHQPLELPLSDEVHAGSIAVRFEGPRPVHRKRPLDNVHVNAARAIKFR